jgi:precorrin-6B methylase 2
MNKTDQKAKKKQAYEKPKIKNFGAIKDHTKAVTDVSGMDGGVAPSNRVMTCVSLPPFIQEHQWLLEDQYTQEKFRAAIFAKVKPGDVVLDLGTGTGLHALFAAQAGAKKVYAVDSEAIVRFAKTNAKKNNLLDKIEFIESSSDSLELPEKADLIITNIGFFNTLRYLPQAISKHLKAGGKVLPEYFSLEFALLEDPEFFDTNINCWEKTKFATDFSSFKECALTRPYYGSWSPESLLSDTQKLGVLKLQSEDSFSVSFQNNVEVKKAGTVHGLLGWYTFHLTDKISFSTQPPLQLSPKIWNQWFLPLAQPQTFNRGDVVTVELTMTTSTRFPEPIWQWSVGQSPKTSNFDTLAFINP